MVLVVVQGSGLCEKDFTVNEKGWYLYKDRLYWQELHAIY